MLVPAIASITLALVFYSIGVWWEHRETILRWRHSAFFALGFACDVLGTSLMASIAQNSSTISGGFLATLHGVSGAAAILLMFVHLLWAIAVLIRNRDNAKAVFHRFSVAVWCVWLIPYVLGMAMGMIP